MRNNDEVGNNFSNVFEIISNIAKDGKTSIFSLDSNFTVSNNSLIGDAEIMRNSSSGDDVISVGNAFSSVIESINNSSIFVNTFAATAVSLNYSVSDNRLTGDAITMQDSSGGNDRFIIGNDLNILVSSIKNNSDIKGYIVSNLLIFSYLIDNNLLGDAESMKKSSGGHDTIELGNNFKINLG